MLVTPFVSACSPYLYLSFSPFLGRSTFVFQRFPPRALSPFFFLFYFILFSSFLRSMFQRRSRFLRATTITTSWFCPLPGILVRSQLTPFPCLRREYLLSLGSWRWTASGKAPRRPAKTFQQICATKSRLLEVRTRQRKIYQVFRRDRGHLEVVPRLRLLLRARTRQYPSTCGTFSREKLTRHKIIDLLVDRYSH